MNSRRKNKPPPNGRGSDSTRRGRFWRKSHAGVWAATCAVVLILGALIWWGLTSPFKPGARGGTERSGTNKPAPNRPKPEETIFSQYAGAASCKQCHAAEFALWEKSNHALAERPIEPARDRAAFDPPRTVLPGLDQARVQIKDDRYEVTTAGLAGTPETFVVQRVIGRTPLRQFLVPFPGGRLQALSAAYDPRSNEWFNVFGNEQRQPGEWGHWTGRGMNWNSRCAACHNTRVRKNYDAATDSYHTTLAEATVSCEACHGPLQAHNAWQAKFGKTGAPDPTIKKFSRDQILDTCGSCHARRSDLTGDFKPGDHFYDHFHLATVDYSDVFYPDGQNHEEDYEYSAFLGSRMHFRGVICLDCHNPHSLKTLLPGNWLCMRCHDGSYSNAPVINPVSHSHHRVFGYNTNGVAINFDLTTYDPAKIKETGGECVNCHMPQTAYMQRHWRHDHGFTIPDPWLTKAYHIPNACNRCHQDKTADWALDWVKKWYGPKMNRPTRRRAELIARAKAGDDTARDGLMELLKNEEIPYWRAVEAGMLSPWAEDGAVRTALVNSLSDSNAFVREAAVQALSSSIGDETAVISNAIASHLNDPARNVRIAAAWAFHRTLEPTSPAAKDLQRFLEFNADQPTGQLQLGIYSYSRNHPETALLHLQKAVAWDPHSPPLREELAVVLSALKRPQEAVAQLQEASRQAPRDPGIHYRLGLAYGEIGDLPQTVAELQKAVQLDPQNARAWYNLGLAQNQSGRTTEALNALNRAEAADPRDPMFPYAQATILARLGRLNEARSAASRALSIRPDFIPARRLLEALSRPAPRR